MPFYPHIKNEEDLLPLFETCELQDIAPEIYDPPPLFGEDKLRVGWEREGGGPRLAYRIESSQNKQENTERKLAWALIYTKY